ncbi:hypothetical protein [Plasmodium yoelii yoelii]|uniref:Uncharacterized protein n=1 Tax=Plasmodium yoelii yoelii TaxID=73239 RepID=Q7RPK9_PLAYO|nr:hypothetical protein [Plasmodium yoelii yoelii]
MCINICIFDILKYDLVIFIFFNFKHEMFTHKTKKEKGK